MSSAVADAVPISYRAEDGVALVTFERPEKRNAWNIAMQHAYRAAMVRAEHDSAVRVVVVTGAGPAFCVGGDMEVLDTLATRGGFTPAASANGAQEDELDDPFGDDLGSFAFIRRMSKPVIAAVNGAAAGTGFILACTCDLRFAAEGSKFTTAMSRLGLPAEQGLSWMLPRLVGTATAFELLVASTVVPAEDALAVGLVNRVLPAAELLSATLEYARALAAGISPASMAMMKQQLYADLDRDLPAAVAVAGELATAALRSPDFREGVDAFRERRTPMFAAPA